MGLPQVLARKKRMALAVWIMVVLAVGAVAEEAQPHGDKDSWLEHLASLAEYPTSALLEVDSTFAENQQPVDVAQGFEDLKDGVQRGLNTLPGHLGVTPTPMHEYPGQWNPYLATMQHPFQLGNQMMGNGLGGFPFPYNGYYPYFNPHPFLATPHTPPSPLGDPL